MKEKFRKFNLIDQVLSVSNKGRIFYKGKLLKFYPAHSGHFRFYIKVGGVIMFRYLHRIVANVWIPNPNGYRYVLFLDADKANCNVSNLKWSFSQFKDGRPHNKHRFYSSKLIVKAVKEFVSLRDCSGGKWVNVSKIAKKHCIDRCTFHSILSKKCYMDLTEELL